MSTEIKAISYLFGDRIREERERLGIGSQKILAEKINVAIKTIGNWERSESNPGVDALNKLSQIGFNTTYIITGNKLPIGISEPGSAYTPAQHLASSIATLNLTEEDAAAILHIAKRLSTS